MSKFFGFLLGVVVALVGPAVFGVLAADGGIELNAKGMALAYGIGALIFWAVVSYFSGAAALGAALVFGVMIYTVHWIPNRMTNFLNDVPGVTSGMIEGIKQYTLNGVVPILAVISLVYGIQLIVRSVQRRRRERAEAERAQREQELAQAQQAAEVAGPYQAQAPYPVAGGDYQPDNRFAGYGNSSYDDLFDDEPEPVQPRNQADEHTAMFPTAGAEAEAYADEDERPDTDETRLVPTDGDQTVLVPTASTEDDSPVQAADEETAQAEKPAAQEESVAQAQEPVAQGDDLADDETKLTPTAPAATPTAGTTAEPATPAASTPAASEARTTAEPVTPAAPAAPAPTASAPTVPDAGTAAPATPAPAEEATVVSPVEPSAEKPAEATAVAPATPAKPSEEAPAEATAVAPAAPAKPSEEAPADATAVMPAAPVRPSGETPDDATAVTPAAPAQPGGATAVQPTGPAQNGTSTPAASSNAGAGSRPPEGTAQAAAAPFTNAEPVPDVRAEVVGQQYRERMDDDATGEHHFGAFENPMLSDETLPQAPRVMDLPGQFRPAGT
ncbi:hypothetical protein F1D05_33835 [Kribbella qitaiheensis]|uniref:Uncharacterized protein n=1 Tax=Kribbella qitaiheensis TaxID=1544730 RepID=A0A7G6X6X4_9ACTN|nr:hypothetical protein [Kribbella qitaiheensis]QNE21989.1 hypothetical protein F1D05_33835 [Kribbella qitaiheensis]